MNTLVLERLKSEFYKNVRKQDEKTARTEALYTFLDGMCEDFGENMVLKILMSYKPSKERASDETCL